MRLRSLLLATTFLTAAALARAEPVVLDDAALDAVASGGLRGTFFVVGASATAAANGAETRSDAHATMLAERRSMSARATSRAGARLR
jgi:hypothetical protein